MMESVARIAWRSRLASIFRTEIEVLCRASSKSVDMSNSIQCDAQRI